MYLPTFDPPDNDLRTLCQEALDLIKSLVGLDAFSHAYADVQRDIARTRIERKQKRALQVNVLFMHFTILFSVSLLNTWLTTSGLCVTAIINNEQVNRNSIRQ